VSEYIQDILWEISYERRDHKNVTKILYVNLSSNSIKQNKKSMKNKVYYFIKYLYFGLPTVP
jgi:uncharacterized protein YjbK